MTFAKVTLEQVNEWQNYRRGVNAVNFRQDIDGQWVCPIEMVSILPEVFSGGYEEVSGVSFPPPEPEEQPE